MKVKRQFSYEGWFNLNSIKTIGGSYVSFAHWNSDFSTVFFSDRNWKMFYFFIWAYKRRQHVQKLYRFFFAPVYISSFEICARRLFFARFPREIYMEMRLFRTLHRGDIFIVFFFTAVIVRKSKSLLLEWVLGCCCCEKKFRFLFRSRLWKALCQGPLLCGKIVSLTMEFTYWKDQKRCRKIRRSDFSVLQWSVSIEFWKRTKKMVYFIWIQL